MRDVMHSLLLMDFCRVLFFTILFTQNRGALIITHAQCTEQNIVSHTTGLTSTVPNYVDTAERVSSLLFSS